MRSATCSYLTGGLRPAGPPYTRPPSRGALRRDLAVALAEAGARGDPCAPLRSRGCTRCRSFAPGGLRPASFGYWQGREAESLKGSSRIGGSEKLQETRAFGLKRRCADDRGGIDDAWTA